MAYARVSVANTIAAGATALGNLTVTGDLTMGSGAQIFIDDGTAANPAIAYTSDVDTGLAMVSSQNALIHSSSRVVAAASGIARMPAGLAIENFLNFEGKSVKTGAYTVTTLDSIIPVDTNGGAVTITLPPTPNQDQVVIIYDQGGAALTNNITIDRNGKNIDGAASNVTIATNRGARLLQYNGTAWFIILDRTLV